MIASLQGEALDRFGRLVRPVECPTLTALCTRLTGIRQVDTDGAGPLDTALAELARWLEPHWTSLDGLGSRGAFDRNQLERECERKGLENLLASPTLCNLKGRFAKRRLIQQVGMAKALKLVGLPLLGGHHRGLDDALNIARMLPHAVGK